MNSLNKMEDYDRLAQENADLRTKLEASLDAQVAAKHSHDAVVAKLAAAEALRHKEVGEATVAREFWRMEAFNLQHPNGALQDSRDYIDRKWSLAQDGFGVVRDDENGNYCYVDDALAVINKLLTEAHEKAVPDGWHEFLIELEWSDCKIDRFGDGKACCPYCGNERDENHKAECKLKFMLAAAPSPANAKEGQS